MRSHTFTVGRVSPHQFDCPSAHQLVTNDSIKSLLIVDFAKFFGVNDILSRALIGSRAGNPYGNLILYVSGKPLAIPVSDMNQTMSILLPPKICLWQK